jgi:hypothetical protein
MSSIPNRHASAQVAALALTLSPYQRGILAKAGEARWFDLPHPWQPLLGSQETTAQALAEGADALLAPVVGYLGAYELTRLGEQVAAYFLLQIVAPAAAVVLAQRLTPLQRSVLGQVAARGVLSMGALPTLREGIVARALASVDYQVLTTLHAEGGVRYALSPLGVQVMHVLAEDRP